MFKRFVITDRPDVIKSLGKYVSRVEVCNFPSFPKEEDFIEGNNIAAFYLTAETAEKHSSEIKTFRKSHPGLSIKLVLNAPINYEFPKGIYKDEFLFANVPEDAAKSHLLRSFMNVFSYLQLASEKVALKKRVNISSNEIEKLTQIGISLSYEKDFTKLLNDILYSAREVAVADSGSLYLVEKDESGKAINLRFKISALDLDRDEFLLPINKKSIAGYVAFTGKELNIPDVYNLPDNLEYRFNREYDLAKSYHTKSMLTVPMMNHRDEVVGVIQLINKKKNFKEKLTLEDMKGGKVFPFDDHTRELVTSLAGQAAVAIENNSLLQEIEALFEGFVKASVSAIEARDPTTSGHSFRVAAMTVALAMAVDRVGTNKFNNIKFTQEQIREIRYASLLHDFGKVGVREKVLVKAKKLEEYEVDLIDWRFRYIMKDLELKLSLRKTEYLKKNGKAGYGDFEAALDMELELERQRMKEFYDLILVANEPTVLEESFSTKLSRLTHTTYKTLEGNDLQLITPTEFRFLSINKGSLDPTERKEIESHVEHTFQFLSQIPWTGNLKMVPNIAHAHHEKLNGSGYPHGLESSEIPFQSKMMTIADIFDALTDSDRPYKKSVPVERALDILKLEEKNNHIDSDLLDLFIQEKVYADVIRKRIGRDGHSIM